MFIQGNGLRHRVLTWAPENTAGSAADGAAEPSRPARTVVLVHGYMDAAETWDLVGERLAREGYRVVAPDMRGFGAGARAPLGSYYHFADYVFDLADLLDALSPDAPVDLVGHSMGGTIVTLFAGAFPERVRSLASLEGLGPPDTPWENGPTRMRAWIDQVRRTRAKTEPALSRAEALRRLVQNHPTVPPEVLATRLDHLVREVPPSVPRGDAFEEPRVAWRVDPLHRTTSPTPFFASLFIAYARRVACPVLFVSGGEAGFHPPDEEARLAAFSDLARVTLEGAGHMLHWTKPAELSRALVQFLG